jgi:hypothetical protein
LGFIGSESRVRTLKTKLVAANHKGLLHVPSSRDDALILLTSLLQKGGKWGISRPVLDLTRNDLNFADCVLGLVEEP